MIPRWPTSPAAATLSKAFRPNVPYSRPMPDCLKPSSVTSRRRGRKSRDVLAEGDENLDGTGSGRPHYALVEFGFPFLKKKAAAWLRLALASATSSVREPASSRASLLRASISTASATRESRSTTSVAQG
jgi:hypothetical protein